MEWGRLGRRKARETGLDHLAIRQHYLKAAGMGEVVAIWRVAEAALHGIADQTAPWTRAGRVHPQLGLALLQKREQLLLRDTRFHHHRGQFFITLPIPLPSAQV